MSNYNIKQHTCVECGSSFSGRKKKYCSKECSDEVRRRRNRERMRKNNPPKPDVIIQCEWCGNEHTVPARTAHQARFCSDECRYTWRSRKVNGHRPIEEYNAERRKQRKIKYKKLEREKAIRSLRRSIQGVIKVREEQERIKELTRDCEECGKEFYDPNPVPVTCSKRCSRRRRNRLQRLYNSNRFNERNLVNTDITLERLFKRDKGVCYLCGGSCNYDDITITDEGHYIVGKTYPSIDHVIPISKGGKHSWENVKLAHHRCNTLKSDNKIKGNFKALANS